MSEMVWRVADALAKFEGFKPSEETRKIYCPLARAAIEAMRESTGSMKVRGADANDALLPSEAAAVYRSMIDEALKEMRDE